MQVVSTLIKIQKRDIPTTEYIEEQLTKLNICPLRWAIVDVNDTMFTVSVANLID